MSDLPTDLPSGLTGRDLRREASLRPGGASFPVLPRRFLPLVHGVARALIPEDPSAAARVAEAAFEALALRARSLPRSVPLATWLWRSAAFAAAAERRRLGLPTRIADPEGRLVAEVIRRVSRLPRARRDAVLAEVVLGESPAGSARFVRRRRRACERGVAKVERRYRRGAARLAARSGPSEGRVPLPATARDLLAALPSPAPVELGEALADPGRHWPASVGNRPLVRSIVGGWRRVLVGRIVRRVAQAVFGVVLTLVLLGATLAYCGRQGYLSLFLLRLGQGGLAKEFPGLTEPARPWSDVTEAPTPSTAAELYALTNIWPARLRLTPAQWKAVQPVPVPVAFGGGEGPFPLRNPKASRSGLAGVMGLDFHWSEGEFEFAGQRFEKVGVRYRGNGTFVNSLHGPKQSFKVDVARPDKSRRFAGITTLNFVNAIPDFSYLKDALSQQVFRELGAVAPRTAYAYLTVDVPGTFDNRPLGLYVLVENIDAQFAQDRFGSRDVPIFKPVTYDLFGDWGPDWKAYEAIYDLKTKATPEQCARVVELAQLTAHADDAEFARRLPEFLDLEEYAAFVAGHVLLASYDGYLSNGQNFYLYLDPGSNRFGFIPWDQDHGWGEFGYVGTAESREQASLWRPLAGKNRFLERVLQVDAFREVYRRKIERALEGPFTVERLYPAIDALAARIRPAVAAESAFRLARFETAISTNWVSGPRDGNQREGAAEGPKAPAHQLKRFLTARIQSVRDQLAGRSEGRTVGNFGGE